MILVVGSVKVHPDRLSAALELSLEHVARSRKEPGCLSHDVHVDAEDEHRLVFIERWRDRGALKAHFQLRASRDFVAELGTLVTEAPTLSIYDCRELEATDL